MKFYIAAKFSARERLKSVNAQLEELGFENVCPWFLLDTDESADEDSLGGYSREEHQEMAVRDLEAAIEADIFIIDTFDESPTGGREVELGGVLIHNLISSKRQEMFNTIDIELVGPIRNIFHMYPGIRQWKNWPSLIEGMKSIHCNEGGQTNGL